MSHWEQRSDSSPPSLYLARPPTGQVTPSSTLYLSSSVPAGTAQILPLREVLPPPFPLIWCFLHTFITVHLFADYVHHTLSALLACSLVHTSAQMLLGWMDGWFLSLKTTLRVCYRSRGPNSHLNLTYVSLGFELGEQPSIAHIQLNQQTRILALQSRIALFFWHPATSKGCLWPGLIPGPTLPGLWPWSFRHTHPISSSLPPFSQF